MEDSAIRFEKAAVLAMALLRERETIYAEGWRKALTQLETSMCALMTHLQDETQQTGTESLWHQHKTHIQWQIKQLLHQEMIRPICKLIKHFSDTHPVAQDLLQVLGLPTEWPQIIRNQLLMKRLDVELELKQLINKVHQEVIHYLKQMAVQTQSMIRLGEGIRPLMNVWFEMGINQLLDGRMAYFRTILRLVGESDNRIFFLYAGTIDVTTRPFCAVRHGRVFDLGEVRAWDRMTWSGKTAEYSVLERCGGCCCRHLLLPVLREEMPKERIYSRLIQAARRIGQSKKRASTVETQSYWCADGLIGQWHDAAFGHSLEYLRRAVGWVGEPAGGVRNTPGEQRMMFNIKNRLPWIEMGSIHYHTGLLRLEKLVWRHEFGHYIDYFLNDFNSSPFSFQDRQLKRALMMDGRAIVMRAGLIGSETNRMRTIFKTNQVVHELMQQLSLVAMEWRENWFDQKFRTFGLTLQQVEKALRTDSIYCGLVQEQNRLIVLLTALTRRDALLFGEHVLEWGRKRHQELGMSLTVGDYFGSMTGNQVGQGHTDDYYRDVPSRRYSESFANGIVLLGDGNLFWTRLLQILTPRFAFRMIEVLKNERLFQKG